MFNLFQIDSFIPDAYLWTFALGVSIGLTLVLTILLEGDEIVFMTFLMIIVGLMVWGGLIDGWIFIAVLSIFVILIAMEFKGGGASGFE